MRLVSLTLTNFKGVRELAVQMNGLDFSFFGDNGTGKTTVADAYNWLLWGKDSAGVEKFDVKTIDSSTEEVLHRLDHSVEGVFDLPSGDTLKLKRVYRESWETKRGSQNALFNGHETEYEINDVPTSKSMYDARIAGLCDPTVFRSVSDPSFFCADLIWKKRRETLLHICGDVTTEQVVESDPTLAPVLQLLEKRTYDEAIEVAKKTKEKAADARKDIGPRLEELSRDRPEERPEPVDLTPFRERLNALQDKRAAALSGGLATELRRQIADAESKRAERRSALMQSGQEGYQAGLSKLSGMQRDLAAAESRLVAMDNLLASDTEQSEKLTKELAELKAAHDAIQQETWEWSPGSEVCATCGQKLPAGDIESRRQAASEAWHDDKARRLAANVEVGKPKRAALVALEEKLSTNRSKREEHALSIDVLKESVAQAEAEVEKLKPSEVDPSTDPEYIGLTAIIEKAKAELEAAEGGTTTAVAEIDAQIKAVEQEQLVAQRANLDADQYDKTGKRIAELEAEDKAQNEAFEKAFNDLLLLERYVRAKVALLTDRINGHFKTVRWKLFTEQLNGGVAECCECTVGGVPFRSLNHGMRINAGLDVINTLSAHYGFSPPVVIDNAESITEIAPTTGQQIRMVVSAEDTTLRYEATA